MKSTLYLLFFLSFLLTANQALAKPLYLVSGGFSSCDVSLSKDNISWGSAVTSSFLKSFKAELKKIDEEDGLYIFTCLFINGSVIDEKKTKLKITSSLYPDQERSIDMSKYRSYVEQIYEDYKDEWNLDHIIFIGHSHGAWLLMKTIMDLDLKLEVKALYTMDAISREHCGFWDYLGAIFKFQIGDECQRFPRDFGLEEKEKILDRVGLWTNMYQQDFKYLHSGPVSHIGVTDIKVEKVTHMSINNQQLVWDQVFQSQL